MARFKSADPMDDIARQARQGSVAAIIQVLNEKLADSGVRTRAVFADGVLQLLCEAADVSQLEQNTLVTRIRQILEAITPRNIRRVNLNSRIVREQQLLWLEEISRDPENQLLWSREITLAKPNFLRQLVENFKSQKSYNISPSRKQVVPKPTLALVHEQRQFRRGIVGGLSLSLLLMLVGWAVHSWLGSKLGQMTDQRVKTTPVSSSSASETASVEGKPTSQVAISSSLEPFTEAVRLAELAAARGQTAKSSAQWLDLATKWQQAADLMNVVPATDNRYKTAQSRAVLYRQNSEAAQQEARKKHS